jgi:colicin import membrane protein
MGGKVALPSLSLPKQKTHWTVGVVIAAGVLFVVLGAAFYMVLRSRQAESDALGKRDSDRLEVIKAEKEKAEAEKAKAEAEKAAAEAKKKEAEAAALAAQKKAAAAAAEDAKKDKGKTRSGGRRGSGAKVANAASGAGSASAPSAAPAAPVAAPKPSASKASKDIDDLLKSFK